MELREYHSIELDEQKSPLCLPGMKQAVCVQKIFIPLTAEAPLKPVEVRYFATSATPKQLNLRAAAAVIRDHWKIENTLHYRKDVLMDEDRHNLSTGNAPFNHTMFRSASPALLDQIDIPILPSGTTPQKAAFLQGNPALAVALLKDIRHLAKM